MFCQPDWVERMSKLLAKVYLTMEVKTEMKRKEKLLTCCLIFVFQLLLKLRLKVQFPLDCKVNVVTLASCQGLCVHLKE